MVLRASAGNNFAGLPCNSANRISLLEYGKLGISDAGFCTELFTLLFKTLTEEKYFLRSSATIVLMGRNYGLLKTQNLAR